MFVGVLSGLGLFLALVFLTAGQTGGAEMALFAVLATGLGIAVARRRRRRAATPVS